LQKQESQNEGQATPITPCEVARESSNSLSEIQQKIETKVAAEEACPETHLKENTAPTMESAAAE
jgi:hypothetical protein